MKFKFSTPDGYKEFTSEAKAAQYKTRCENKGWGLAKSGMIGLDFYWVYVA